jgi:hypothetical protein
MPMPAAEMIDQIRTVAELKARVEGMGREIGELKDDIKTLTATVNALRDQITEARGGWRTLMLLGGAAASAGGAISWAVQHLTGKGP